uniref:Ribonuclease A-domain domain-containing protein n=1 Tax=Sander lucioperca TaxID=283035 RepID=A0A8C9ZM50_SANLU
MKISVFAGVLLISAPVISMDEEETPAAKFKRQHINEEMNFHDCKKVMNDRGITDYNGNCKLTNTFIKASIETVREICKTGGQECFNKNKPDVRNLRKSSAPFDIVECTLVKYCPYVLNGAAYNRYIVVSCSLIHKIGTVDKTTDTV